MPQATWPQFPCFPRPADFAPLPHGKLFAGVYFLYKGDQIVYIGQSVDCHEREREHKSKGKYLFDRVVGWECARYTDRVRVEAVLCLLLSPRHNQALRLRKRKDGNWVELGRRVVEEEGEA